MSNKTIVVFCGNNNGEGDIYSKCHHLLDTLCQQTYTFVHGGGNGLMNLVRIICNKYNRRQQAIVLKLLYEKKGEGILDDNTVMIDKITERKKYFIQVSDIYLVLPGGPGTLDELMEVITWDLLTPVVIYNVNGYYNWLKDVLENISFNGFGHSLKQRSKILITDNVQEINEYISGYDISKTISFNIKDSELELTPKQYKTLLLQNY